MGSKFVLAQGRLYAALVVVLLASAAIASHAMSIEPEPVKVTHRNSGPRYDIDEVEKTKLTSANQERQLEGPPAQPDRPPMGMPSEEGAPDEAATPIGHVAIRRIFLFPVMRPGDWSQQDQPEGSENSGREPSRPEQENEHEPMPSMFAKPFWPFMTPARPSPSSHQDHERPHRPHLFGADEASRPAMGDQDKAAATGNPERVDPARPQMGQPMFDPIQMMMDMMHQAISSQLSPNFTTDLNNNNKDKEPASNDNAPAESSDERPQMPGSELTRSPGMPPSAKNETREDIVEIDGKKYLRKVVTNRHVGENIIFMTRRLIFVPLNETDSTTTTTDTVATTGASAGTTATETTTTTSTTESPSTTAPVSGPEREASDVSANDRVGANKPVTTNELPSEPTPFPSSSSAAEQTVATASAVSPTTLAPTSSEQPTSSEPSVEATTQAKPASIDRNSDAGTGRASERLIEETPAKPTQAPVASVEKPVAQGA